MHIYQHIQRLIGSLAAPVFLEIGCHWCEDTRAILPLLQQPVYHCFEPDPRNIPFIRTHSVYPRIQLYEYALADFVGEANFYLSEMADTTWTASSSLLVPALHLAHLPTILFKQQVAVAVSTLDQHCAQQQLDHIDFIWMDAQGAEAQVIRGGRQILARTRYLYTEYNNRELFAGQQTLAQWLPTLPGTWQILEQYAEDILLRNESFTDPAILDVI